MKDYTYWADEDAKDLDKVASADQKKEWADWLEERINRSIIRPLKEIITEDIQPSPDKTNKYRGEYSSLLIYSVSICCAIESMGKYLKGGVGGKKDLFFAFLDKYMDTDYRNKRLGGKYYKDLFWKHFRNGIAHGFAIAKGKFEQSGDDPYFIESQDSMGHNILSLNWDKLMKDFEQACKKYLQDVRRAPDTDLIAKNFLKVFREVNIDRK